jgi:hypothetical protein
MSTTAFMMRRLLIAFGVAASSCGPMNPTVKKLDLPLGQYILVVNPGGGCTLFWPGVGTLMTLSHEGGDWVARSQSAADGSVEFRFHEVADSSVAGVAVAGSLVGTGNESRSGFTSTPGVVSFAASAAGGSASVSAETVPLVLNGIAGRVTGHIVFSDNVRGTLDCAAADIGLHPPVPCELDRTVTCGG